MSTRTTAVKAAGIDAKPPEEKPYGVRTYGVTDPEGYDWGFMEPTGKGYEKQGDDGLTEVPASAVTPTPCCSSVTSWTVLPTARSPSCSGAGRGRGVRAGSELRTAVGVLAVDAVDELNPADITDDDARRSGFSSRTALLDDLASQRDGSVYRIALHVAGPDPRVELAAATRLPGTSWRKWSDVLRSSTPPAAMAPGRWRCCA